ncbi:Gfo/Idh/MocA family oxidoreductase [Humibacter soli]
MTAIAPVGVGVIGAGNISDEYLSTLRAAPDVELLGIADLDIARAAEQAEKYGIPFSGTADELLDLRGVELIVNLTIPAVHAEVTLRAIQKGKHVWAEKPIALDRADARRVLDAAAAAGVLVGNAPDTILGEGIQTAAALLASGRVGAPQTVLTLMQGPGPDAWHPRPQFLFARGAGPLFDIGPYYVTTLVQLLGPIESVSAAGHRAQSERIIGSGPDAGTRFPVEVDTHLSVLSRFASGVVGTSVYSFDSPQRRQLFEITGSTGVLRVPVSGFDGDTDVLDGDDRNTEWVSAPAVGSHRERGVGAVDLARAVRSHGSPRASAQLAHHVLDVMLAIEESAASGAPVDIRSTAAPVAPVPPDWDPTAAWDPDQTPHDTADQTGVRE